MEPKIMPQSYWDRERMCTESFMNDGPFHLITAAKKERSIFCTREDYVAGVNATAVNAARSGVKVYMYVIMSNHGHWLLSGELSRCENFFGGWSNTMAVVEYGKGIKSDLRSWRARFDRAENLNSLRNMAVYIPRNAYLVMPDQTPFGFEWTCSDLFFNGHIKDLNPGVPYESLSRAEKRKICRSANLELPSGYRVRDGVITRESFVEKPGLECMFNSGNQFFNKLARNAEVDLEIAHRLGEELMIPDDEMYSLVNLWCRRDLSIKGGIVELTPVQRLDIARKMHDEYNSDNRQIAQILKIPRRDVDDMYPKRR